MLNMVDLARVGYRIFSSSCYFYLVLKALLKFDSSVTFLSGRVDTQCLAGNSTTARTLRMVRSYTFLTRKTND